MYLQESNRKPDAIAEYEKLSEQLPDNGVILNNLAWFYYETGDARALRYAESDNENETDNPEKADTMGWILLQRDEALRGLENLQKAADKLPQQPSVRYHLAAAYAKLGRKDAARQELAKLAGVAGFPEQEEARKLLEDLGN
jgi:predicted Zn-dependent protease